MKFLSLYLPAYHRIELNDKAWGEGFTEWDNVRQGKKLFKQHYQPIVPFEENYYDLSRKEDIEKQIDIANQYNLDGFIFYHYWFGNNVKALEKPAEILRDEIDKSIEYCFCWANHSWLKSWHGKSGQIIAQQVYGEKEEWINHINYLIPFFKDSRYIKIDNRPVFYIYNMSDIKNKRMFDVWNEILEENGFGKIYLIEFISSKNRELSYEKTDAVVEFEPLYTTFFDISKFNLFKRFICKKLKLLDFQDYDVLWRKIINRTRTYKGKTIYKGGFVGWDNSARKGYDCMIVKNNTPEKFGKYLEALINNNRANSSNEMIIINAWNEWSEGAYLEPDEKNKFAYLKEIQRLSTKNEQ